MKLINRTDYDTGDLRAFILAGLRAMGADEDKTITVREWSHEGYHTGHASYPKVIRQSWKVSPSGVGEKPVAIETRQGQTITLRIPRDPAKLDLAEFALLIEHEVGHTLGLRHREMSDEVRWCGRGKDQKSIPQLPAWAVGLVVRRTEATAPVAAPVVDAPPPVDPEIRKAEMVARREEHARLKLAEWERKARAAVKLARKYRAKVRYYERRRTAAMQTQTQEGK